MLTIEQRRKYEETLGLAREELDSLEKELATEVARAKERIQDLQAAKKSVKLIHDGACARLGIKSNLEIKDYDIAAIIKHA
jgi:hypothetical protein